jgi:hypothetical protein
VFSLAQLWLVRPYAAWGEKVQTIESGWQVYPNRVSGSGSPYLFVFFNPDGYLRADQGGRNGYLVNQYGEGFIYYDNPGWVIGSPLDTDLITQSEGPDAQFGLMMRWVSYDTGDWELWIGPSVDELRAVGYIPGPLYGHVRDGQAFDTLEFGGEVSSQAQQQTTGIMGSRSGRRPSGSSTADFGQVAFIKYLAAQRAPGQPFEDVADLRLKMVDPGYGCTIAQGHGFGTHIFFGGRT